MNIFLFDVFLIFFVMITLVATKMFCGEYLKQNSIITILWTSIMFLSSNFDFGLIEVSNFIYKMIFQFLIIFNILFILFYKKGKFDFNIMNSSYSINTKLIIKINIVAYALTFIFFVRAIAIIFTNGFNMKIIRDMIYVGITNMGGLYSIIFRTIPTAIFMFTILIAAFFLSKKEKNSIIILGIINIIVGTIMFGGRNFLLSFIVFYMAFLICNRRSIKIKINKKYIIVMLLILVLVTVARTNGKNTILTSIYDYFVGSLSYLQYLMDSRCLIITEGIHFGSLTFGFITEPIIMVVKAFGASLQVPSYYLNTTTSAFVNIGTTRTLLYNTNSTVFYTFLLDFGKYFFIGFIIYTLIVIFFENSKNKNNFYSYLITIYLYYSILNSSINYKLIGLSTTIVISLIFICVKKNKVKGEVAYIGKKDT